MSYITWIKANYPNCDLNQRGFGEKSFERDETNFKAANGLMRS